MTDNGTSAGFSIDKNGKLVKGFNAGMKGKKASAYEGGHRVPFVVHYPGGKGKKINALANYLDIMPTFLEMCGMKEALPKSAEGQSLIPLFKEDVESERYLFADTQRDEYLKKGRNSCVMYKKWRLVNNTELYNIKEDPGQEKNVAKDNPSLVIKMQNAYELWWGGTVEPRANRFEPIPVGSEEVPEVLLYAPDLHYEKGGIPACHQNGVRTAYEDNIGFWAIDIKNTGKYRIAMYRWEPSLNVNIGDAAPEKQEEDWGSFRKLPAPVAIKDFKVSELYIDDKLIEKKKVDNDRTCVEFTVELNRGMHFVQTDFIRASGKRTSAYYAMVKRIE